MFGKYKLFWQVKHIWKEKWKREKGVYVTDQSYIQI